MSEEDETDWTDKLETNGAFLIVIDNSKSDARYALHLELH